MSVQRRGAKSSRHGKDGRDAMRKATLVLLAAIAASPVAAGTKARPSLLGPWQLGLPPQGQSAARRRGGAGLCDGRARPALRGQRRCRPGAPAPLRPLHFGAAARLHTRDTLRAWRHRPHVRNRTYCNIRAGAGSFSTADRLAPRGEERLWFVSGRRTFRRSNIFLPSVPASAIPHCQGAGHRRQSTRKMPTRGWKIDG